MNKQTIIAGYLFILAAITFWMSWCFMPDPGTTDTVHILKIVKEERMSVLASIIVQILSSVLYVTALFFLMQNNFGTKKINIAGVILLAIGAMGLCADAFFHLLAYYMTDSSVNIRQDVVAVMDFMQTDALIFLVPLLIPLFIGGLIVSINLARQEIISKRSMWITSAAFVIGILFAIAAKAGVFNGSVPVLAILGLFATGQAFIGIELANISERSKVAEFTNSNC